MDDLGLVWSGEGAPSAWLNQPAGWADALAKGGQGVAHRVVAEARNVMVTAGLRQVWLSGAPFLPRHQVVCAIAVTPHRWLLGVVANLLSVTEPSARPA